MKLILVATLALFASKSFAAENLVCALKERGNPANYASMQVMLQASLDAEYFYAEKALYVGDYSFSFELQITREGNRLDIGALFTENNRTEDEIDNTGWDIDLRKARAGKPIVTYVLEYRQKEVADFVCYYNK